MLNESIKGKSLSFVYYSLIEFLWPISHKLYVDLICSYLKYTSHYILEVEALQKCCLRP